MPTAPVIPSAVSTSYPDSKQGWQDLYDATSDPTRKSYIQYIGLHNPQLTPEAVSVLSDAQLKTYVDQLKHIASSGGLVNDIKAAVQGNISGFSGAASSAVGVVSSIPDFLKLITSGNFWDRVLFIFGGLLLVIVGLVLLLHKSIPVPPVIPV